MKKLTIIFIVLDVLVGICFFITYGIKSFKNTIISTSMSTKTHQYIAYTFYSEKDISDVLALDAFIPIDEEIDLNYIVMDTAIKDNYNNPYDEEILTREDGQEYKVIDVKVGAYEAFLVAIYNPSKIKIIHSKVFNANDKGKETILNMCNRYNALVCINGGGFVDYGYGSDIPIGYIIEDKKVIWSSTDAPGNLIGFTDDNKLMLINATGEKAISMGMRDGLEFGPFLIVNGRTIKSVTGGTVGGYSRAPRTAIAQRKDGVVLFLVTNGTHTSGPNMGEMIDTLLKYGAFNAANLDGGTSTTLTIEGAIKNTPRNVFGMIVEGGRRVVTGFGLMR